MGVGRVLEDVELLEALSVHNRRVNRREGHLVLFGPIFRKQQLLKRLCRSVKCDLIIVEYRYDRKISNVFRNIIRCIPLAVVIMTTAKNNQMHSVSSRHYDDR